jgi:hypothetical protein
MLRNLKEGLKKKWMILLNARLRERAAQRKLEKANWEEEGWLN